MFIAVFLLFSPVDDPLTEELPRRY